MWHSQTTNLSSLIDFNRLCVCVCVCGSPVCMCTLKPGSPYVAEREVRTGGSWGPDQAASQPSERALSWAEAAGWPSSLAWIDESLSAGPTGPVPINVCKATVTSHISRQSVSFFIMFTSLTCSVTTWMNENFSSRKTATKMELLNWMKDLNCLVHDTPKQASTVMH